jgi:hypothetical protein
MGGARADPIPPTCLNQWQARREATGANRYRVTAPNLGGPFVALRAEAEACCERVIQQTADGLFAATGAGFDWPRDTWETAFESCRQQAVV